MSAKGVIALQPAAKSKLPKPTKYYGQCMHKDGSIVMLVAKAYTELEACVKLHKGYTIKMVIDLLSEEEMELEWAKIKPSLIQRSQMV